MSNWYKMGLPDEIKQARKAEKCRRGAAAQTQALKALSKRHPQEYRELYLEAKARIDRVRGPVPGDDDE